MPGVGSIELFDFVILRDQRKQSKQILIHDIHLFCQDRHEDFYAYRQTSTLRF